MEFQQLRAFLAVAEEAHFGRAAKRLHMAQPPLSRTIRALERELGTRLFDRTTRTVRLTSAGEALIVPARDIFDGCRIAEAAVHAAGKGETGRIRIGFAGPSSHVLIGRLARRVRRESPGIELSLRSVTYADEGLAQVMDGALDLAIVRWGTAPSGIAARVVQEEHYVLAVPADHPLAGAEIVSVADLRDEAFITLPADSGSSIRDALITSCYQAGFAPDIVQVAPDTWTAMALVSAGVGITISVDSAVEQIPGDGLSVVRLLEGIAPTYARLAWRENDDNPALRTVLCASEAVLPTPPPAPGHVAT